MGSLLQIRHCYWLSELRILPNAQKNCTAALTCRGISSSCNLGVRARNNIFSSRITIFCPNADKKLGSTLGSRMTMRESLPLFLIACELPRLKNKNQATINIQNMELTFELLLNFQQNPETAGLSCFSLWCALLDVPETDQWSNSLRILAFKLRVQIIQAHEIVHNVLDRPRLVTCDAFMRTTRVCLVCWIESSDNKKRLWLIVSAICAPDLQDVISSL